MSNYREQLNSVLQGTNPCPSCAIPLISLDLCYSTTANDLCCGTATPIRVWVESTEVFADAVDFWADSAKSSLSPNGFYSNDLTAGCSTPPPGDFYNTAQSSTVTKNNYTNGEIGGSVTYTVAAGTYSSSVSQAAADQLATDDVDENAQTAANQTGTCTCPNYPEACNGYNCLIEGTLITMPDGSQEPIESLSVGDVIYSVEIEGLPLEQTRAEEFAWSVPNLVTTPSTATVVNIVPVNYDEIYSLNNGLLEATWYHLHLVKRDNEWKIREFRDIMIDDEISLKGGTSLVVTDIELIKKSVTVYKLDIEELDVYYANNILTHNK